MERDELVRALVLEAGRLMEDISPELAFVLPPTTQDRKARLSAILEVSEEATALMRAAVAIERNTI